MARFLSSRDNPFRTAWKQFKSLDLFIKLFVIAFLLIVLVTPYIIANYQTLKSHGAAPEQIQSNTSPDTGTAGGEPSGVGGKSSISTKIVMVAPNYNAFYVNYGWENYQAYSMTVEIVDNYYGAAAGLAGFYNQTFGKVVTSWTDPTLYPIFKPSIFPYALDFNHSYTITLKLFGSTGNIIATASSVYPGITAISVNIQATVPVAAGHNFTAPMTIKFFSPGTNVITGTPQYTFQGNAVQTGINGTIGTIGLTATGVQTGTYDISIQIPSFLTNYKQNISLTADTSLDMGTLLGGDINHDEVINLIDFSALKNSYAKSIGDVGFNSAADLNQDGTVNLSDWSILARNYGKSGPILAP